MDLYIQVHGIVCVLTAAMCAMLPVALFSSASRIYLASEKPFVHWGFWDNIKRAECSGTR